MHVESIAAYNSRRQISVANKFCAMAPNILEALLLEFSSFHLSEAQNFDLLLDIYKIFGPLK